MKNMNTEINENEILKEEYYKNQQKEDKKKSKLVQAFENNLKISEMNLNNKFSSFETWELTKSKRLLYELTLPRDKKIYALSKRKYNQS